MPLSIKALAENDYQDTLCGWWEAWGWPVPSKEFLPDNGTCGFMVYDKDTPVVAGFLYKTNSKAAWVDWIISNKEYRGRRKQAILLLLESFNQAAKTMGYEYTIGMTKHQNLIEHYKAAGYNPTDTNTTVLLNIL